VNAAQSASLVAQHHPEMLCAFFNLKKNTEFPPAYTESRMKGTLTTSDAESFPTTDDASTEELSVLEKGTPI
jgi:hypothetical protein